MGRVAVKQKMCVMRWVKARLPQVEVSTFFHNVEAIFLGVVMLSAENNVGVATVTLYSL